MKPWEKFQDQTKEGPWNKFAELVPEPTEEAEQPKEDESIFRSIADVPLSLGRGAVQGVRFLADTFGADNPVSNALRGTESYIGDLMSAGAKRDAKEISRIMKEAEDKGVGAQLLAALKALTVAPVDLVTQALGTAAPTILGGIAGLAIKGGLKAGATAAQIASGSKLAGQIGAGVGGAMGAGVVKSTIYDVVYEDVLKKTGSEEIAKAKGENLDEVAIYGREGIIGERKKGEIGIHSIRSGDITGEHTVMFTALRERLELTHKAHSRDTFAYGTMQTIKFMEGKPAGFYEMKDVLKI